MAGVGCRCQTIGLLHLETGRCRHASFAGANGCWWPTTGAHRTLAIDASLRQSRLQIGGTPVGRRAAVSTESTGGGDPGCLAPLLGINRFAPPCPPTVGRYPSLRDDTKSCACFLLSVLKAASAGMC